MKQTILLLTVLLLGTQSFGAGMYADNVAGAIGVFHYLNDKVMLSAGASYGGDSSFAGNVGITIGF